MQKNFDSKPTTTGRKSVKSLKSVKSIRTVKSRKSVAQKLALHDDEDESSDDDETDGPTLKKQFQAFVRHKNERNPGTHILLSQSDFWMKQAGVLHGRTITTTDTGVCYFKFKKYKLSYREFLEFLQILSEYKNVMVDEIVEKLINCGPPPPEIHSSMGK